MASDTPRARQLGAEIREAREAKGLGLRQFARDLGISHNKLLNWEQGKIPPPVEDLASLLGALGVAGERRDELLALARDAADPNWVTPGINRQYGAQIEYEEASRSIVDVNVLLVPGLVQTADYAREMMLGDGVGSGETNQRVLLRLGRKETLRRGTTEFTAIIGEYALRYPQSTRKTTLGQLRHLLDIVQLPNVHILVHPLVSRYSPCLEGAFALMEFDRGRPVVSVESYRSTTMITSAEDVADYQKAVDKILRQAMSPEGSVGLITDLASELERTT